MPLKKYFNVSFGFDRSYGSYSQYCKPTLLKNYPCNIIIMMQSFSATQALPLFSHSHFSLSLSFVYGWLISQWLLMRHIALRMKSRHWVWPFVTWRRSFDYSLPELLCRSVSLSVSSAGVFFFDNKQEVSIARVHSLINITSKFKKKKEESIP